MSSITPDLELPTLVVDGSHWQTIRADEQLPLEYHTSSRLGFRLSTAKFNFAIPDGAEFNTPNVIQVVAGKEQLYAMAFDPSQTLHTLDSANLVPLYGSKAFGGFQAGQKVIIAIGHLAPSSQEHPQPRMTVLWAGVVNIT